MNFLKVALREAMRAEDTSQVAPRAIVHLVKPPQIAVIEGVMTGRIPMKSLCGEVEMMDMERVASDRVVSCAACISAARKIRETAAHSASVSQAVSTALRCVSEPAYPGFERRTRPRFIEASILNGEDNMKTYRNVTQKGGTSVHALFDGDTATACGALNYGEVHDAESGKAVSCDACMKALVSRNRASDHRMPMPQPVLHHNFSTHQASWRAAINVAIAVEKDPDQRAYWEHELAAFDLAYSTFDHSLASGRDDMPKVIHHGGPVRSTPINSIKILAYGQDGRVVRSGTRSTRKPLRDFEILMNTPAQHMNADIAMRDVRDIIDNCESRMVGDGSGDREYVLSQNDIDKLRGLRDAFIAESIIAAQRFVNDADLLDKLRRMCGYVENGSSEYITIGQDDATTEWGLQVGDSHARSTGKARRYSGTSFHRVIFVAAEKELAAEEPQADMIPHFDHKGDLPPVKGDGK